VLAVVARPLSAEHQYSPEWFLKASKLRVFPVATVLSSLTHVIFGRGLPMAEQWNTTSSFSVTVWSAGSLVKLGKTAKSS